jgi:hypothetical protein
MPVLIFILLIILIAQFGFWNTLGSVLGAVGLLILVVVTLGAIIALTVMHTYRKARQKF